MNHEKRAHLLSIGEMAEANRVSIATLRLYDRMGLLQPSYRDEETNYRYYDIRQTSRLDIIRYMRNLNMSLTDIQTLLEKEDIMLIEQKLIEKNNQNLAILADYEGLSFYISENKFFHTHEIKVTPLGGQGKAKEKAIKEAMVFC